MTRDNQSRPKRVGIDARLVYQTGVGVYIRNLLYRIAVTHNPDIEFHVFARARDIFAIKDSLPDRCTTNFVFHITEVPWHGIREQIMFLAQIVAVDLDLMHFPYFSWPVLYFRPFVATVHDTILLTHATGKASTKGLITYWIKRAVFRLVLAEQVRRARRIIVPSHTVASELTRFKDSAKNKIDVFYEGVDESFSRAEEKTIDRLSDTEYFLYVGNCYPHKNVETLIDAFELVVKDHPHTYLALVGPQNSFSRRMRTLVYQRKLQRSVLFSHNVTVSELKWMYSNARALVFPSKAEGFGLPIVEAAYCGCPLILSDIPVFHEVINNQAEYFGLFDVRALRDRMIHALQSKSRVRYELDPRYSFALMADEILRVYRRILDDKV